MTANAKVTLTAAVAAAAGLASYILLSQVVALEDAATSRGPASATSSPTCRLPAVAGGFYPSDADELRRMVDGFLGEAPSAKSGKVIALIAPHAGYQFSGHTAGKTYAYLKGARVRRVVVIGVSHSDRRQPVWFDDVDSYRTPLGDVPVDRDALSTAKLSGAAVISGAAKREHSIEVQLPFLKEALPQGWKLVPVLIGGASYGDIGRAVQAIASVLDDATIVCVSTDFTHYGAAYDYLPFTGTPAEVKDRLAALDSEAAGLILAKDPVKFGEFLTRTKDTICGSDGVLVLLNLLPQFARGQLVEYVTSGDKTGDFSMSVSYIGMVFTAADRDNNLWGTISGGDKPMATAGRLTDAEKNTLLNLARATLAAAVAGGKKPDLGQYELTQALKDKRGAFVTLTIRGQLRGCIGYVEPIKPLYESVMDNATNAALHDPRFSPVGAAEVKDVRIEISAMSPLEKITDTSKIEIGKHGVMLSRGFYKGLLLPQVATEYEWNPEEFLRQTCRKASLPSDAWKDPATTIEIFSADVFHEEQ